MRKPDSPDVVRGHLQSPSPAHQRVDGDDVNDEAVAAPGRNHVPVRDAGAGRPRQAPRVQCLFQRHNE